MTAKVTKAKFSNSVKIEISEFMYYYCDLKSKLFGRVVEREKDSLEKEPLTEKQFCSALKRVRFIYPNKDEEKIKPLLPTSIFRG